MTALPASPSNRVAFSSTQIGVPVPPLHAASSKSVSRRSCRSRAINAFTFRRSGVEARGTLGETLLRRRISEDASERLIAVEEASFEGAPVDTGETALEEQPVAFLARRQLNARAENRRSTMPVKTESASTTSVTTATLAEGILIACERSPTTADGANVAAAIPV